MKPQITYESLAIEIDEAYKVLKDKVVHTPTIRLPWLDQPGLEVWAKLECQQHTGSFKYRGAMNALLRTPSESVITASAGNHALAICSAAKSLGKDSHIIAPVSVSELKAKRIVLDATDFTVYGSDLAQATRMAMKMAAESKRARKITSDATHECTMTYISPYADFNVAAGAGTLMVEAVRDAGDFDHVLVPMGGGGLVAAVAAWCKQSSPRTEIIGTHPEIFGRSFTASDTMLSEQLRKPTEASYCDGLGVQLVEKTPFAQILDSLVSRVIQVSEDAVSTAIAQTLRCQSLLIEGSAATTVAALRAVDNQLKDCKGRMLILLTGGNVAPSVVARSLVSDVHDFQERQAMGLRTIISSTERYGRIDTLVAQTAPESIQPAGGGGLYMRNTAEQESKSAWQSLAQGLLQSHEVIMTKNEQRRSLTRRLHLDSDAWCQSVFDDMSESLKVRTDSFIRSVLYTGSPQVPEWTLEERYRVLLQLQSCIGSMFERASASYDQAVREWYCDTSSQNSEMVNYDRYGAIDLRALELDVLKAIAPGTAQPVSLMLTSSGMAAYQVLQQYALQSTKLGDKIVVPPYIYFEAMEQLKGFSNFLSISYAPSFLASDIIRVAEIEDAKIVLLDPVANIVGLPHTDLRAFASEVCYRAGWENRIVIIDGSMISGGLSVFDWFHGPHTPLVLYSESASKYLQLGLDLQMAGLIVVPSKLDEAMKKIRRNTGTVMYGRNIQLFPRITYRVIQDRLLRLTQNAEQLSALLEQRLSNHCNIAFPSNWRALGWRHGGALVTIEMLASGLNNREGLSACINLILRECKQLSCPITNGVSFGFSTTRISASSSMAEDSDPFLRISVGNESAHITKVADAISVGIANYLHVYSG